MSLKEVRSGSLALALGSWATCVIGAPQPPSDISRLDLVKAFATRSPWRLVVKQGPPAEDYGGNPAPGALHLCLQDGPQPPCLSEAASPPSTTQAGSTDWGPHYLVDADVVYPQARTAAPLLRIVTASMHAGDGGQIIATQLLRYDRASNQFRRIYFHFTGSNNNQETRFVTSGPLQGDVISAEPTSNSPYGYWITVSRLTPTRTYKQVLRYRSSTPYNDGNSLAVIDSEMPNIERRLGLWRPGSGLPPPLPSTKPCPNPRLKGLELWCQ